MMAQFFQPPMKGAHLLNVLLEDAGGKADATTEERWFPCLVLAWDDHCEGYLTVDRGTGLQSWHTVDEVTLDCSDLLSESTAEPCSICGHRPDGAPPDEEATT